MTTDFYYLNNLINKNIDILHSKGYIILKKLMITERILARISSSQGKIISVGNGPHAKVSGRVFRLSNEDEVLKYRDLTAFGNHWHHDYSIAKNRGTYTFLYAIKVPPKEGGTFFMNMRFNEKLITYLSEMGIKNPYDCNVIHSSGSTESITELVITHPVTKDQYLYLGSEDYSKIVTDNGVFTSKDIFNDLSLMLDVYRHQWEEGDLLVWDNRIVCHKAEGFDSKKFKRIMIRCAVC